MEALLKRNINFMLPSDMKRPNFKTINPFYKNRLADVVDNIFIQVVRMIINAEFISAEVQYINGYNIKANANKYTFIWERPLKLI